MPIVELNGVELHYQVSGIEGRAVVAFVNSLGSSMRMWTRVLPTLERQFTVIRFDTRGHGLSGVPSPPYSVADIAGDLLRLMDFLRIERAHVCGLSLGGQVAQWLGIRAPERVHSLVMANTGAKIGTQEGWDERIETVRAKGMGPIAELMPARWFTSQFQNDPSMAEIAAMVAGTSPEGYIGCCYALREADFTESLTAIRIPTLVISGRWDPATPPEAGRGLHKAIAGSRYLELDASHLSAWECPLEFANAVTEFFRQGEGTNG